MVRGHYDVDLDWIAGTLQPMDDAQVDEFKYLFPWQFLLSQLPTDPEKPLPSGTLRPLSPARTPSVMRGCPSSSSHGDNLSEGAIRLV